MRHVVESRPYRKDLRRAGKGRYSKVVDEELPEIIDALADDILLPVSYRDHQLHGVWEGSRECHVKPDFLLVYTYIDDDILKLERLGSHAEFFGM